MSSCHIVSLVTVSIVDLFSFDGNENRSDRTTLMLMLRHHCPSGCGETHESFIFKQWIRLLDDWLYPFLLTLRFGGQSRNRLVRDRISTMCGDFDVVRRCLTLGNWRCNRGAVSENIWETCRAEAGMLLLWQAVWWDEWKFSSFGENMIFARSEISLHQNVSPNQRWWQAKAGETDIH